MKSGPFTWEGNEAMAEDTHTTPARASRRTLLAATLGLGALPAAATASPDAELIRLAAALEANHAEAEAIPVTRSMRGSSMRR
jgi:hypothetical protein